MKKEPPPEARAKASSSDKQSKTYSTEAFAVLQTSCETDPVPDIRHVPSSDRSLVREVWWAMVRKGIRLPAQEGVIVLQGWRP